MRNCSSGTALIEFALVLPILVTIFIGTIELSRLAIIHLKLDKAANAMADFVTQGTTVSRGDLDTFSRAVDEIIAPFSFDGTVIFSSVQHFDVAIAPCAGNDIDCVSWQYTPIGGDTSKIGGPGGNASIPGGYTVNDGQNIIVAELYMNYNPLLTITSRFIPGLGAQTIYKLSIHKPRRGTLTTLN